jgi:hypothetical protein
MASNKVLKMEPGLPAYLPGQTMTGEGVPTDQKDFLIPMARVLDPKSPEVEKRGPNYVPNAEPGDILIKNAPIPLIKGDKGFIFQPCSIECAVIEWVPRSKGGGGGGGFVAKHPENYLTTSKDCELRPHPEDPTKRIWFSKITNNMLVETRYYGGYAILENSPPMPLVLPFASTGHTVAKQWNMLIALKRVNNNPVDLWAVYYHVATRLKQRRDQAWYLFDIRDAGPLDAATQLPTTLWAPTQADYDRGKTLHDSLAAGTKAFEQQPLDGGIVTGADDGKI